MASAIETVRKELTDVQKQLDGYEDLVKQRDRLSQALRVLEGASIATAAMKAPSSPKASRRRTNSRQPIAEDAIIHAIHVHGIPAPAAFIREQLGLDESQSNALSIKLKAMCDAGTLKRIGERRASRYVVPAG